MQTEGFSDDSVHVGQIIKCFARGESATIIQSHMSRHTEMGDRLEQRGLLL